MILKMFEGSLLVFALGNLIFSSAIYGEYYVDVINVISLGIALLYICFIFLAPASIERKVLFATYETFEKSSYTDCLYNQKFSETYWTENPATMFAKENDINDMSKFITQGIYQEVFDSGDAENYD